MVGQGVVLSLSIGLSLLTLSCGPRAQESQLQYRSLRHEEILADFQGLVNQVRSNYGPLLYKEKTLGIKLDKLVADTEAAIKAANNDAAYFDAMARFVTALQDGHVSIQFPQNAEPNQLYYIPIIVAPVEGKAYVVKVGEALGNDVSNGEEVVSIDGKTPAELLELIKKYDTYSNPVSDEHLMYNIFIRPFHMMTIKPTEKEAVIVLKDGSGSERTVRYQWRVMRRDALPSLLDTAKTSSKKMDVSFVAAKLLARPAEMKGTILEMGGETPFFYSDSVQSKFNMVEVSANEKFLKQYGLTSLTAPKIFAALYRYEEKTFLLIRQPGYTAEMWQSSIAAYKAVLDQYDDYADYLIIDQTHNPGGYLTYVENFFQIFAKGKSAGVVQQMRADRAWIRAFDEIALELDGTLTKEVALRYYQRARTIEAAYDKGEHLSVHLPFNSEPELAPHGDYHWTKPVLLLADELAGSCGDILPMLMQRNGVAKIFGNRTMGLGGNVEKYGPLPHSQVTFTLTRGLFTTYRADGAYREEDLVENRGITPDFPRPLKASDLQDGFSTYVEEFTKKAMGK